MSSFLPDFIQMGFGFLFMAYYIGTLIPYLAVTVRRLHDTGNSGWMIFVSIIPLIGIFWYLYLMASEGEEGENFYGPDPKGFDEEELLDEIGNNPEEFQPRF